MMTKKQQKGISWLESDVIRAPKLLGTTVRALTGPVIAAFS